MYILVLNSGSSSIKYQLYDSVSDCVLSSGIVERIGLPDSFIRGCAQGQQFNQSVSVSGHGMALEFIIQLLTASGLGSLKRFEQIAAVGHRVVHGGLKFTQSTLVNDQVINHIEACIPLAPLHNPHNLLGIREAIRLLPDVPHVAVFDTTFHLNMPERAALYPLPYEYSNPGNIRRFGFHGTSYRYVTREAANFIAQPISNLKMIVCHIGNGVSAMALQDGKSIDTSMGFTPLEGLMMGTRSGDLDPGLIFYLQRQLGLSDIQMDDLLNRRSGLFGISGVSNDMRDICAQAELGNQRCQLALEMFAYRIKKYIGAYTASLGGLDVLVFTAGIGENSAKIRSMICEGLEFLGVHLDESQNKCGADGNRRISTGASSVSVLIIPTHEERIIVEDTLALVGSNVNPQEKVSI